MAPQKTLTPQALAGLAMMGVIWGGSFLCIKLLLEPFTPFQLVALRVGLGATALWAYILLRRFDIPRDARTYLWFLLIGAENVALPFFLITWGETHTHSGIAGILNASTAVFGVLVAAIAFADERLTARKVTGVLIGFAGIVLTIGPQALDGLDPRSMGQLAIAAAGLAYAIGAALVRAKLGHLRGSVAMAGMLTGATVVMAPLALVLDGAPSFAGFTPELWAAFIYLTVIATALAYMVFGTVVRLAGSGNTTLVTLIVAPVSVLLGALILHERLDWTAYAGFALIALGFSVIDGRLWQRKRVAPAP